MPHPESGPARVERFLTTRWSVVQAAGAADTGQGDLRAAIEALCRHGDEAHAASEGEDWTTRIQGEPVANELLRRVATSWCAELARG